MKSRIIEVISNLPPYYQIAEYLWGHCCDIDSDGNSDHPDSTDWSELTLILRSDENQRIDIDPLENQPNQLIMKSEIPELLDSVERFLREKQAIK